MAPRPGAERRPRILARLVGLCIVAVVASAGGLGLHRLANHNTSVAGLLRRSALCPFTASCPTGTPIVAKRLGQTASVADAQTALTTRVCGSPAIDGYAHVKPQCLEQSPTATWWQQNQGNLTVLEVHMEQHADYDGLAVRWGINNKKASAEECAAQCRAHEPGSVDGPFRNLPCNAFVWCAEEECFEPDAHRHTRGDCWLKFTEAPAAPEVNMRGELPSRYRQRHPKARARVQWVAGVLLPRGVKLGNGTWSPRWSW